MIKIEIKIDLSSAILCLS